MPRACYWPRLLQIFPFWLLIASLLCGCTLPLFSRHPGEPEVAKNPCLVLALPASGPYSAIASRIKTGAEAARRELAATGVQVRLENVNTEAPDWLTRLALLPEMCTVVGGPLQDRAYASAKKSGAMQQRVFFAFVPTLQQGDEGVTAWRFFPSPQDQVDALVDFATDRMNMRTYGAFYPADNYGRRMTEIMEKTLQKRQIPVQKASYTPGAPATWRASAAQLINPRRGGDGRTPVPQTVFEALFVPDSWKNMDMITNSLLLNGEDRLALLGTTLWEQGLTGRQVPKAEKYALAVFPGAWNKATAPKALKGTGNDFWSALGYDFVNFGARVALAMRPDAAIVKTRAQKASPAIHGMAPIYWDDAGVAHQRMYLFQITPSGMTPLNEEGFRQKRASVSEAAALRMQGWGHINPSTGEAEQAAEEPVITPVATEPAPQPAPVVEEAPRPVAPAPVHIGQPDPGPGVMSTTPRSSYKLSLPVRKQE